MKIVIRGNMEQGFTKQILLIYIVHLLDNYNKRTQDFTFNMTVILGYKRGNFISSQSRYILSYLESQPGFSIRYSKLTNSNHIRLHRVPCN
jgi:hypothetical protein